jgi:hypothetical protein
LRPHLRCAPRRDPYDDSDDEGPDESRQLIQNLSLLNRDFAKAFADHRTTWHAEGLLQRMPNHTHRGTAPQLKADIQKAFDVLPKNLSMRTSFVCMAELPLRRCVNPSN